MLALTESSYVGVDGIEFGARHRRRIERTAGHAVAREELLAVFLRYAEHVADHDHRQLVREILDHIHLSTRRQRIEQAVHHALDLRPHLIDAPGRERFRDEAAQARVVGRIAQQHGAAELLEHRLLAQRAAIARVGNHAVEIVDETLVLEQASDVVVAGQHPHAHRRFPHRRALAQQAIGGVGIAHEGGVRE